MNTNVLYFTLALCCLILILSQFFDDKYLTRFLVAVMPNSKKKGWF